MLSKRIIFFLFLLPGILRAQYKDAGMWLDAGLSMQLSKRLEVSVNPEIRLNENISRISRAFADLGLQYKFSKYFFTTFTYRSGIAQTRFGPDLRQRMQFGIGARGRVEDFTVTLQTRWQGQITSISAESDADFVTTLRSRIQVKYSGLKKTDLSTSFETFNTTSIYQNFDLTNWRWMANLERKLNKRQSLTIGYLIQKSLTDSPMEMDYVFLLSYQYSLNLRKKEEEKNDSPE